MRRAIVPAMIAGAFATPGVGQPPETPPAEEKGGEAPGVDGSAAPGPSGPAKAVAPAVALKPEGGSNKVIYDDAFFSRYNVQNAEDMLRRIPGVTAILNAVGTNTQARGFGSGGDQVLVGGRRFPGKSNEITKTLRRLRYTAIQRVELIRGASDDIDVQSTGVVVNIILKPGETLGGGGNYDANLRFSEHGRADVDGLVNYAGSIGRLGYSLGLERNLWSPNSVGAARWTFRRRDERYFYPDGTPQELRPQRFDRHHDKWIGTGGLTYDFAGGARLQLNGLYEYRMARENDRAPVVRFNPQGVETIRLIEEHERYNKDVRTLEVGSEFRARLWRGELTLLGIVTRSTTPTLDFRNRTEPTRFVEVSRNFTNVKTGEDIARLSYAFPLSSAMNLEVGGEASRNDLTQDLEFFFDRNGDGRLEAISVPTAFAEVKEKRGELFVNHKWTVTGKLSINSSLNYEFSKLSTNSAFNPGRSLQYWKPRVDARYALSPATQLRGLVSRTVSQLDFANFVPAYNVIDDRIEAGNPGLLPERVWTYEFGYEHRLKGDAGVVEGRLFYQDITDPIDRIPLDQGGALLSAQGNLGRGKLYGAEAKASVRMVPIGLRDLVVTGRVLLQDSSTTDPFTGQKRRLRADRGYNYDIGFRHDLTKLKIAYGVDYLNTGRAAINSDLFSYDLFRIGPLLTAFVERRLTANLVLRFEGQNLLGSREYRQRTQYTLNQIDGRVRRLDRFRETRDRRFALRLSGTF